MPSNASSSTRKRKSYRVQMSWWSSDLTILADDFSDAPDIMKVRTAVSFDGLTLNYLKLKDYLEYLRGIHKSIREKNCRGEGKEKQKVGETILKAGVYEEEREKVGEESWKAGMHEEEDNAAVNMSLLVLQQEIKLSGCGCLFTC